MLTLRRPPICTNLGPFVLLKTVREWGRLPHDKALGKESQGRDGQCCEEFHHHEIRISAPAAALQRYADVAVKGRDRAAEL